MSLREQIIKAAQWEWPRVNRAPRLHQLAEYINQTFPELEAKVEKTSYNTDRHPKGVCWRIPGKGRRGNELKVYRKGENGFNARPIFSHNSAETYRQNYEVCKWILKYQEAR